MSYREITSCRVCGNSNLVELLSFEPQFLSPTFVETNSGNKLSEIKIPLTLLICADSSQGASCGLVQLRETTDPALLYTNYFYRSSTNTTMLKDLKSLVVKIEKQVVLDENDVVLDIGANDGSMLAFYESKLRRIGVEPAKNIDWSGLDSSIQIVNDFFSSGAVLPILGNQKAKIITCCAMFYDLDKPNDFVSDLKTCLADDGIICIQLSYLLSMLVNMNFYDICHEHLEYYSLETLNFLFNKNGLRIFDAELNDVNGGSLVVYVCHLESDREESRSYRDALHNEAENNLRDLQVFADFEARLLALKTVVLSTITAEIEGGGKVLGLGASTKGNVLLQFFDLTKNLIPYIGEINREKIGLRTLGSDIPIVSDADLNAMNPTLKLVLPWYFKDEIVKRETDFLTSGGKLLFPMPYAHIVSQTGEQILGA
jgi:hypothetical protein